MESCSSNQLTNDVRVVTQSFYVPERSDLAEGTYYFAYTIRITNEGLEAIKVLRRRWLITDGFGYIQEVDGEGVVGQQPRIEPGHTFEYTSCCPLPTQYGSMEGLYEVENDTGAQFEVAIAAFSLLVRATLN